MDGNALFEFEFTNSLKCAVETVLKLLRGELILVGYDNEQDYKEKRPLQKVFNPPKPNWPNFSWFDQINASPREDLSDDDPDSPDLTFPRIWKRTVRFGMRSTGGVFYPVIVELTGRMFRGQPSVWAVEYLQYIESLPGEEILQIWVAEPEYKIYKR